MPPAKPEMLAELHSHLYGCLHPDDLRWLAARNRPRWEMFELAFRAAYGQAVAPPSYEDLFGAHAASDELLRRHYYFRDSGNFPRFQSCFSVIIAVSSTEPEELPEVLARVAAREVADHAEYRMLFSPRLEDSQFEERVQALAEGARSVEREHTGRTVRIAVSLLRDDARLPDQYETVRRLQNGSEAVRQYVTGIDFCSQEEGFPPLAKREFLARVHADNARDPDRALAVLYHVGESFEDKSVESAVRWVVQSARLGAHRLGHAVALGVPPELYLGTERRELLSERLAQIEFELEHAVELEECGVQVDARELKREQQVLGEFDEGERAGSAKSVVVRYDARRTERLRRFQDWALEQVRLTGAVIESCPTSNLRIAGLGSAANHPLPRFVRSDLRVVIGADDPGILDTDLHREFEAARQMGLTDQELQRLRDTAAASVSERLVRMQTREEA